MNDNKIDIIKERYLMFIDTETIGSFNCKDGVLPFEIGVKIYDNMNKKVVKEKSYIIKKFFNNKYIMLSSFSANKYPYYLDIIKKDKRYILSSANDISKSLSRLIKHYNIKIMVAHNGDFDKTVISRLFEEFKVNNSLENINILDTREISKIITFSKSYANYCIKHKDLLGSNNESRFITKNGRVRTTAQAIYSYIINEPLFDEAHTGLEDIDIEIVIYNKSLELLGNTIVNLNTTFNYRDYSIVI